MTTQTLRESAIEAYLDKRVRQVGGLTFKIAPTIKGLPDRCVLAPHGGIYLVELKTSAGVLSPAQIQWHLRARGVGHVIHVLRSREQVESFVRWIVWSATSEARKKPKPTPAEDEDLI
jgi:hypothetical protein